MEGPQISSTPNNVTRKVRQNCTPFLTIDQDYTCHLYLETY